VWINVAPALLSYTELVPIGLLLLLNGKFQHDLLASVGTCNS